MKLEVFVLDEQNLTALLECFEYIINRADIHYRKRDAQIYNKAILFRDNIGRLRPPDTARQFLNNAMYWLERKTDN